MSATSPAQCPKCDKTLRLPPDSAGKKVKCSGCSTVLAIRAGDGEALVLARLEVRRAPDERAPSAADATDEAAVAGSCPGCGKATQAQDAFCNHCGIDLAEAHAVARRMAENRAESKRRRGSRASASRRGKMLSAGRMLLILGALFLVFGTFSGFQVRRQAATAHARLHDYGPDEVLEFEGAAVTVAELRRSIDFEVVAAFGTNYLLAGIMVALFFWAKRSPFPATLTGLCVYLVVLVLNAVVEPATLLKGVVLKVLIIAGLVGGMNAALAERAAAGGAGSDRPVTTRSKARARRA